MSPSDTEHPEDLPREIRLEIIERESLVKKGDPFALLGVTGGASPQEVRAAYYALSKRLHPDRFFRKNLGGFRPRLESLFQKLTEAHQLLTDPGKREGWLRAHPESVPKAPPVDPVRRQERRTRLARHPYLAKMRVSKEADSATSAAEAIAAARRAVDLDPRDVPSLCRLAGHLLRQGRREEAASFALRALEISPTHKEAKAIYDQARMVTVGRR